MIVSIALLFVVFPLILIFWFSFQHRKISKSLESLPSPRSLPFLGHLTIIKPDIEGFVDQVMGMAELYPSDPRMVVFWTGPIHHVMIYSGESVEMVFGNSQNLNKGMFYNLLVPWLGYGLLTRSALEWRPRRKLLTPTFHYDILKNFVQVFNSQSLILIEQLNNHMKTNKNNIVEDLGHFISLYALDIICQTSMGQSVNAQVNSDSQYVKAVLRINDIIQQRIKNPLMWSNLIFNLIGSGKEHQWALDILHSFTRKVIVERRDCARGNVSLGGRLAFLDLLLEMEENGQLTQQDIQEEVDTFMFEGHDTTATAILWALHTLGNYPDIQQRVYDEIITVCGSDEEVTLEHLTQFRYMECCIKEILRLYPSVPIISRRLDSDVQVGKAVIPAGTQAIINIFLIHRDPKYWHDPEVFNPDRFLPENVKKRHPFSYVPFSAGSRNCIGQRFALMEEKVALCWILRNFMVKSMMRRDELRHKTELILRPAGNVPVKLIPRH